MQIVKKFLITFAYVLFGMVLVAFSKTAATKLGYSPLLGIFAMLAIVGAIYYSNKVVKDWGKLP